MSWHLFLFQLIGALAVHFLQSPRNQWQTFHRTMHAWLFRDQRRHSLQLVRRYVDEKDVRQSSTERLLQISKYGVLHEKDGQDQHDPRAERGENRDGLVPRPIEIR